MSPLTSTPQLLVVQPVFGYEYNNDGTPAVGRVVELQTTYDIGWYGTPGTTDIDLSRTRKVTDGNGFWQAILIPNDAQNPTGIMYMKRGGNLRAQRFTVATGIVTVVTDPLAVLIPPGYANSGQYVRATELVSATAQATTPPPAGGPTTNSFNEKAAAPLVNATSVGDAGNRSLSFDIPGSPSVFAPFVHEVGLGGVSVGASSAAFKNQVVGAVDHFLQPFTPSGDFTVEARMASFGSTAGPHPPFGMGIFVRDGAVGDSAGEGMWAGINPVTATLELWSLDAGVWTLRKSLGEPVTPEVWHWVGLQRFLGQWGCYVSLDRSGFIVGPIGLYPKALVVAKGGVRISQGGGPQPLMHSCDAWDVVQ